MRVSMTLWQDTAEIGCGVFWVLSFVFVFANKCDLGPTSKLFWFLLILCPPLSFIKMFQRRSFNVQQKTAFALWRNIFLDRKQLWCYAALKIVHPIPLSVHFLCCDTLSDLLPCDLKIPLFSFHTWIYFNLWISSVQPASCVGCRQVESELQSCCSRPCQLCVSLTHMFWADNPWTKHPRAVSARPPHTHPHTPTHTHSHTLTIRTVQTEA